MKMLRLLSALWALFYCSSVFAAGTVPGFSLSPQFDLSGKIMPGCRLYIIQAGTVSTPQNAYQDSGLTLLQPNPMLCDASGRLGQFFVSDGSIKLRLTDKNGVQIFAQDGLLVVGASSGGGGGSPVDPTTILATGDLKVAYGTGILTGFVRANGRTIGSATSGATERANADCQTLFQYLWGADANLAVSGGRGASAAADWAANKTLTLPDYRGRTLAGLDDMGNTPSNRLTATYFGASATTLGAAGGSESHLITTNEMAQHRHAVTLSDPGHVHDYVYYGTATRQDGTQAATVQSQLVHGNTASAFTGISIHAFDGVPSATDTVGFSLPHAIVQPTILATIYLKL